MTIDWILLTIKKVSLRVNDPHVSQPIQMKLIIRVMNHCMVLK